MIAEGAIQLRLIELNAELAARRSEVYVTRLSRAHDRSEAQEGECRVLEATIAALDAALVDVKAERS